MTLSAPEKATPPTPDPGRPLRIGMIVVSEYESDPRVRRQAEALVARGDEVTVVALAAPGRPEVDVVDGVKVVHLPTRKYRGSSAKAYLSLYGGFGARAARWLTTRPARSTWCRPTRCPRRWSSPRSCPGCSAPRCCSTCTT
ncbi:hypothetical protein Psuf_087130 [Phytohabitans suffuscus]|uniref:Glycosyltransferase subfamily 4-like N-terminal domain-containing protein n=1 Tax=Phytohabitans suffuscus TaxID=624315 RepID=A0A6F8YYZ2_9ACTN|nr:hypothetical protein Psuf_087130 [Phytohabitans suffuscus]